MYYITVHLLGILRSPPLKTFADRKRIVYSPLMYKECGEDLYLAGEGMRLYDLCAFPDMFELAS